MQTKKNEIWVGIFLLAALLAALFVCLKAANVTGGGYYAGPENLSAARNAGN